MERIADLEQVGLRFLANHSVLAARFGFTQTFTGLTDQFFRRAEIFRIGRNQTQRDGDWDRSDRGFDR